MPARTFHINEVTTPTREGLMNVAFESIVFLSLAIAKASTRNPVVTILGPVLGGGEN